jgi:hypothetical protein
MIYYNVYIQCINILIYKNNSFIHSYNCKNQLRFCLYDLSVICINYKNQKINIFLNIRPTLGDLLMTKKIRHTPRINI